MMVSITVDKTEYSLDRPPDLCPYCHNSGQQILVSHRFRESSDEAYAKRIRAIAEDTLLRTGNAQHQCSPLLDVAWCCPILKCGRLYVVCYEIAPRDSSVPRPRQLSQILQEFEFKYKGVAVPELQSISVDDRLNLVSPDFVEIYQQAHMTEQHGYSHIAGMGYRKSLEFLIKDYVLKHICEEKESEWVKGAPLSQVIDRMVSDPNVKSVARGAAWLGNDETHYVRKWTTMDVEVLKRLLRLVQYWILSSVETKEIERRFETEAP